MKVLEEKDLWFRFKERGDEAARDELVLRHMRTVKYIAGRMAMHTPPSVEMDDLIGWGILGLMDAVDKFDHAQDIKFSTYASIRVRGAIIDQIRSLDWAPRSLRALARKIGTAREQLRHAKGRDPSPEEIAEVLGIPAEQVDDALSQLHSAHILSLDDYLPSDEAGETRKLALTSDSRIPTPEAALVEQEKRELLVDAILQLPESQQKVLHLYYYQGLTLKEIGVVLEVTESRVCQIHSAAMKRLRAVVRGDA